MNRNHPVQKRERDRFIAPQQRGGGLDRFQSASRRLALRSKTHLSVIHLEGVKAFGETPKAADEDVRAPQSIRIAPVERAIGCTRRRPLVQKLLKMPARRVSVFIHPIRVKDLTCFGAMAYTSPAVSGIGLAYKAAETVKGQSEK